MYINKHSTNMTKIISTCHLASVSSLRCFTFTFYFEALLAYVCCMSVSRSTHNSTHPYLIESLFRNIEFELNRD